MTHLIEAALIYAASMTAAGLTALVLRAIEIACKTRVDFAAANDRRKRSKSYV